MRKHLNKKIAAVAVGAVALTGTGVAYAYWTTSGTGTGAGKAGTVVGITVNQTASSDDALYPGGPASTLSGTFTNPNTGKVQIDRVTAEVTSVTGGAALSSQQPACTPSDFAIGGSAPVATEIETGSTWGGLTVALRYTSANQDSCKGAVPVITYTAHALPAVPAP